MAIQSIEMANEIIGKLHKENRELIEENRHLKEVINAVRLHVLHVK